MTAEAPEEGLGSRPGGLTADFDIGDMGEGFPWRIAFAYICEYSGATPCRHCGPKETLTRSRYDGSTYTVEQWVCPRVVQAKSSGGFDGTAVCLDCILEAGNTLPSPPEKA